MRFVLVLISALCLCVIASSVRAVSDCTFTDTATGNFYDLSDFASDDDYTTEGKNHWDYTFYYRINICQNVQQTQFNCPGSQAPALQLEKKEVGPLICLYVLGILPAQFSLNDTSNPETGGVVMTYSNGDGARFAKIHLACDPTALPPYKLEFLGEPNEKQYDFRISGPAGCPKNGSCNVLCVIFTIFEVIIFLFDILLIPAIIAYFVIGILVKRFAFKKTGRDIVPNVRFWVNIPFILKDGVVFSFTGIRDLISKLVAKLRNYKQMK